MTDLDVFRKEIDNFDRELIELLSNRLKVVKKVGEYKKYNDMPALQSNRWQEVLDSKKKIGIEFGLNSNFIEKIWNIIHDEALFIEGKILGK